MVEVAKAGQVVPESVLKKQKRSEEWALAKKQESELLKKKKAPDKKLIFHRVRFAADLPHSVSLLNPLFIPTIVLDPYRCYNVIIS
ncbi:hypothetical protein L6452_41881 [Arctium lappa]|uniref:Uncharacterized protein n=1 Tax=Arctium lappa TaxID=4217 RepID=A0ACB8XHH7_ARCLA|nr:hypothetical protein L6452_41881 [Arctium lappa]